MILLVCGSPRPDGLTSQALDLVQQLLIERGCETRRLGVHDLDLPLYGMKACAAPQAAAWRQAVREATALVIGSPEYHGSFSGGLKNLLDYLEIGLVEGKPAAMLVTAGSPRSGVGTLSAMRTVLRNLHVPVIVEQMAVSPRDHEQGAQAWTPCARSYCISMVAGLLEEIERRRSRAVRLEPAADERLAVPVQP
jgi:NAD(P)H-dependent FMN reductase